MPLSLALDYRSLPRLELREIKPGEMLEWSRATLWSLVTSLSAAKRAAALSEVALPARRHTFQFWGFFLPALRYDARRRRTLAAPLPPPPP